jgi:hypothetical protein
VSQEHGADEGAIVGEAGDLYQRGGARRVRLWVGGGLVLVLMVLMPSAKAAASVNPA